MERVDEVTLATGRKRYKCMHKLGGGREGKGGVAGGERAGGERLRPPFPPTLCRYTHTPTCQSLFLSCGILVAESKKCLRLKRDFQT